MQAPRGIAIEAHATDKQNPPAAQPYERRHSTRLAVLFALLVIVYHSNLRPIAAGDSLPTTLIPMSLIMDGTVALDRYGPWLYSTQPYSPWVPYVITMRNGHYYSVYPIAQSILVAPLYAPPVLALRMWRWSVPQQLLFARIYEKFVAVALAAASVVMMLLLLERLAPPPWPMVLALVYAFGTTTWTTSSQALWQHTSGELLIVTCAYLLARWWVAKECTRWLWLAGLCAGLAVLVRPTNVAFVAAVTAALFLAAQVKFAWLRFGLPPVLCAAAYAAYSQLLFGNPFGPAYGAPLSGNLLAGLAGVLLSPGRGLLVYSPVVIFAVAAFFVARPRGSLSRLLFLTAVFFIAGHLFLVAKWPVWWGGYSWGPRLLTEAVPAFILLIAIGAERLARSRALLAGFAVAAAFSLFTQAVGAYCYPKGLWNNLPVSVDLQPERLWDWRDNPVGRTVRGGFVWEPYDFFYEAMTKGPDAARRRLDNLKF